jgi:hypothetical protein
MSDQCRINVGSMSDQCRINVGSSSDPPDCGQLGLVILVACIALLVGSWIWPDGAEGVGTAFSTAVILGW